MKVLQLVMGNPNLQFQWQYLHYIHELKCQVELAQFIIHQFHQNGASFIENSGTQTSQALTFADDDTDGIYTATIEIPITADAEPELSGNVTVTLNDDVIDMMTDLRSYIHLYTWITGQCKCIYTG